MSNDLQVFTIGHSSHPTGTFLWLLRKHRIKALVDIRRYPGSKRHPQFGREELSGSLAEEDMEYHWLEALGGNRKRAEDAPPSSNRGIEDKAFRNYADYMATDEFHQAVASLLQIAERQRAVLMCAEADFRHCHRRLLGDHLAACGVTVLHILPSGEVKPHTLTPYAKILDGLVTYPGPPTLFDMS